MQSLESRQLLSTVKFKCWSVRALSSGPALRLCSNITDLIARWPINFYVGRRPYVTFYPLPPLNCTFSNWNSITNEIAISMSEEHRNEPRFFSPLWNAKPQTQQSLFSSIHVHLVIHISELQFIIAFSNLLSCENARSEFYHSCMLIPGGPEITEQSIQLIFQDFALINSYFLRFVG